MLKQMQMITAQIERIDHTHFSVNEKCMDTIYNVRINGLLEKRESTP